MQRHRPFRPFHAAPLLSLILLFAAFPAPAQVPWSKAKGNGKIRVLLTVDGSHSWAQKESHFLSLMKRIGKFELQKTGDLDQWLPENLKNYDLVVVHTTGGEQTDARANGLQDFLESGGGGSLPFRSTPEAPWRSSSPKFESQEPGRELNLPGQRNVSVNPLFV